MSTLILVNTVSFIAGIYLIFGLSLSLSVISATGIADIVNTLLFSALCLRIIEILTATLTCAGNLTLTMEVSVFLLIVPSIFLEIISVGFRSMSLGFRLFANISAGHVLSDIVLVIRYLALSSLFSGIIQVLFSYFVVIYEFLVASIQLGVFLSLFSVYAE